MVQVAFTAVLLLWCVGSVVAVASKVEYINYAVNTANVLNSQWFNNSTGIWQNMWWNSANMVTTLADFSMAYADTQPITISYLGGDGTFTKASIYNGRSYLNDYYDDEGWWALAWIKMYDLTGDTKYLATAETIFADLLTGNGATCGGHWWSKEKKSNNLIADSLYLATAASLANRVVGKSSYYQSYAQAQMDWFSATAPWTTHNTLRDGLNVTEHCAPRGSVFTYNQGAMIGALMEMQKLTGNTSYLDTATKIAQGTLKSMVDANGILTEFASGPGSTDAAQFKGVFVRNLVALHRVRPDEAYVSFLQTNADSIWAHARNGLGGIGFAWQGPFTGDFAPNAATQSSALDCLIAAAAVSSC